MFNPLDMFGKMLGGNGSNSGSSAGPLSQISSFFNSPVNNGNQINWGNALLGTALGGVGQYMQDRAQKKSMNALANFQPGSMSNLSPEARQSIEYSLGPQEEQRRRQLRNTYASLMPGTDITNNTNYLRDMNTAEQQIAQNRNAAYQNAINRIDQMKYAQLQDLYNINADRAQGVGGIFGNLGKLMTTLPAMDYFNQLRQPGPMTQPTSDYLNQTPSFRTSTKSSPQRRLLGR